MKKTFLSIIFIFVMLFSCYTQATTLTYGARSRGFRVLDVDLQYDIKDNSYTALTHTKTRGWLRMFDRSEMYLYSAGSLKEKGWSIDLSTYKRVKGKKETFYEIDFSKDPTYADFTAAVLSFLQQDCAKQRVIKVKDAKRKYKITIESKGIVEPDEDAVVQAENWYAYDVLIEPISGKCNKWFFKRYSDPKKSRIHLYFATVPGIKEAILMKAEMESLSLGTTRLKLESVSED